MKKKTLVSTDKKAIPDERLELLFRHAGLSEKQAKLYRLLLEIGEERASTLARRSGIKRGNTYALLEDLVVRRLATAYEKGRIRYYRPEPPAKLLDIINTRESDIAIAKELAHDMVPTLTTQWKTAVNRPTVAIYEGKEGLQRVFSDIYAKKREPVWGCVDLEKAEPVMEGAIAASFIPLRKRNRVLAKSILADSPAAQHAHNRDTEEFRESILVDKELYPLPAEIDVYEDKVAFLSFESKEFIGLIVQNQAFATTLKSIFTLAHSPLAGHRAAQQIDSRLSGQSMTSAPQPSVLRQTPAPARKT